MRGLTTIAAVAVTLFGPALLHAQSRDMPLPGPGAALIVQGLYETDSFNEGARLFSDRVYTVAESPDWLCGLPFLRASIEGGLAVTVARAGVLTVITADPADPLAEHSHSARLEALGFVWVKAPAAFQLFGTSSFDVSRTYQKQVTPDEAFSFPK